jgi:hypothetical protein
MQHRSLLLGAAVALAWLAAFGASGAINNGLPLAKGKYFDRVFIVLLENQAYIDVVRNDLFKRLSERGTLLTNYKAIAHPSQPNYLAITSGNDWSVSDAPVNLNTRNIVDLLEAKGLSWKAYAENYPTPGSSQCFTNESSAGLYYRKHVPFISYDNVRNNPARCQKIVDGKQLDVDIKSNAVPHFSFFTPNIENDGHDTGLGYAATWITTFLGPRLHENNFIDGTLFVITFDEDDYSHTNHVYTLLLGPMVDPNTYDSTSYDHYSLLRTIESNWDLGNLGRNDTTGNTFAHALTHPTPFL